MKRTSCLSIVLLQLSPFEALQINRDFALRRPDRRRASRINAAADIDDFSSSSSIAEVPSSSFSDRREFVKKSLVAVATGALPTVAHSEAEVIVPSTLSSSASSSLPLSSAALRGSITLPPIGLGAWAWGDPVFWGYDPKNDDQLREVFDYAVQKDLAFFDTAELYGLGVSETLLGKFRDEDCPSEEEKGRVVVASKFAAYPFRTKAQDVVKACEASVRRLGGRPIDLYQIHFPNAWSNEAYWDGLADAYDKGLVRAVGVSNYGIDAMRACHAKLAERGIKLATNQIQLSLLYRWPIENGLLDACRDLDVQVLSYSPLALGFLTGKYNRSYLPSGPRQQIAKRLFEDDAYEQLLTVMGDVAADHEGATLSQVALNWAISKGTIPIPGARNIRQMKQNLSTLDWTLSPEEERSLDLASSKVTGFITPDKNPFPRKDVNTGLIMYDS